jgi:hypothetical protein
LLHAGEGLGGLLEAFGGAAGLGLGAGGIVLGFLAGGGGAAHVISGLAEAFEGLLDARVDAVAGASAAGLLLLLLLAAGLLAALAALTALAGGGGLALLTLLALLALLSLLALLLAGFAAGEAFHLALEFLGFAAEHFLLPALLEALLILVLLLAGEFLLAAGQLFEALQGFVDFLGALILTGALGSGFVLILFGVEFEIE